MKRPDIAKRLAKESHITPAAAADPLDRVVGDIRKGVGQGRTASLAGQGTVRPLSTRKVLWDVSIYPRRLVLRNDPKSSPLAGQQSAKPVDLH